jgi:hypothetical protein
MMVFYRSQGLGTKRNGTKRETTHNFLKRNETENKFQVHETKRNVAIENITAQVYDVDISTAHWAQFTFRQPRKNAFYKAATRYNYFFRQKF